MRRSHLSETTIVALIGTGATALVALAGIIANVIQARTASRQQESIRQYNELIEFYNDVANEMYERIRRILVAALEGGLGGTNPDSREKIANYLREMKGEVSVSFKLKLYGAPDAVHAAWVNFDEGMLFADHSTTGIRAWVKQQEARVDAFLDEAGAHTASVRPQT
jgi:hypothetical protein